MIFNEYACAVLGMLQTLCGMGTTRVAPPAMEGELNAPVNPCPERVSITRQGVTGTKR